MLKKSTFVFSTFILIISNFILRFLGLGYRILQSRLLGSEGMGLFQLTFQIFLFAITFTSSGIPIAVTKIIAHKKGQRDYRGCINTLKISGFLAIIISLGVSATIYFNLSFIVKNIIKDERLYFSLIALLPSLPVVALAGVFRGYFYGIKNVKPAATSQIIEQILRIGFVLTLIYVLRPSNVVISVTLATLGITIGELGGLLYLVIKYPKSRFRIQKNKDMLKIVDYFYILEKLLVISIPITFTRLFSSLMQTFNSFLIPIRLQVAGLSPRESVALYGEVTGMTMPLFLIPSIFTTALVTNLIPNISEELSQRRWQRIQSKSLLSLKFTLFVSLPLSCIFLFFSREICAFLYNKPNVGVYLKYLSLSSLFFSLQHVVAGILHGMGKQMITTVNNIIGTGIHFICIYFLVSKPNIGIYGYIIGSTLSSLTIFILNYRYLNKAIKIGIKFIDDIVKPVISSFIMAYGIKISYSILSIFIPSYLAVLSSLFIGCLIYLSLLLISGYVKLKNLLDFSLEK